MRRFPDLPIKQKLTLISVLATAVALVLAAAGLVTYELGTFKKELVDDLASVAGIIGYNGAAALAFNDTASAAETLKALDAKPHIVAACIYDRSGHVFATYPHAQPAADFPPPPAGATEHFGSDRIDLFRPIIIAGENTGTIYLRADLKGIRARLERFALILCGVMLVAMLVAYWIAAHLQRAISEPVAELVAVASRVAAEKDYALRAVKRGDDELGRLMDGFNEMLAQIQSRDGALQNAQDKLEDRVAERTRELQQENAERKRAEEALRLFSSAVEQSKESILITDAQIESPGPAILFVNPAFTQMTGYTSEEVIGKNPRFLQGPRTDRTVLDRLRKNLTEGDPFAGEAVNYRKDGTEYNQEWQIAPLRNTGGKITHFVALQRDVTGRKQAEAALEKVHRELVDASRQAGMAEVATGVLHNVGNVLNSVNVSATLVADHVRHTKAGNVAKLAALFAEHKADLPVFLANDPRGRMIPDYLGTLSELLTVEHATILGELDHLHNNIEHIKDIVTMQQTYARASGVTETISVSAMIEDALRINADSLTRHGVTLIRDYQACPAITTDKHKVMQILINLVRNAKQACNASGRSGKVVAVRATSRDGRAEITITDNGVGIPAENLTRIFNHGFTTRKEGHGFGLHSAALAARELGGSLTVRSDGPGLGATFVLELPCQPPPRDHANSTR